MPPLRVAETQRRARPANIGPNIGPNVGPNMGTSIYPRDAAGLPIGNYLQVHDAARPILGHPLGTMIGSDEDPVLLVIGGGYTGVSAALRLAELAREESIAARIVLVEGDRIGSGPSGKSAGHVCGFQASDDDIRRRLGVDNAQRLFAFAADAAGLVRTLVATHGIPCDLRDGYLSIDVNGRQTPVEGGLEFGIDPYPFVLGLAQAARAMGVEIHEGTRVIGIEHDRSGCLVTTRSGAVRAKLVLACGGHRMAEDVPLLGPLRCRTTELRVSTIVTDPIPQEVLERAMPSAGGRRFPFARESSNVAYGSIDQHGRIIFGARASAWRQPDAKEIADTLSSVLPELFKDYRATTGRYLRWRPLVVDERICFTRDALPNVGAMADAPRVHFVQALGGHGLALGTALGRAAADKLWAVHADRPELGSQFDLFAHLSHGWLPPWQPWRKIAASFGLRYHAWKESCRKP
jgi:gamma-glutamylputrescine oxidase